jgi:hypothetical protein
MREQSQSLKHTLRSFLGYNMYESFQQIVHVHHVDVYSERQEFAKAAAFSIFTYLKKVFKFSYKWLMFL